MRSFRSKKSADSKSKTDATRDRQQRRSRIESFEPRHMMTANPVTDVAVQPLDHELINAVDHIEIAPSLNEVNSSTGVNYVHEDYGFDGSGQTIAVIDTGIAWDHYALGGGYGEGHRVVGGWDFAENDADPYDDGPAGFHGSHVAGIIGSDDASAQGVASGADLVALRVFDDYGAGNFDWVEDALQWVHDHRNDFENPITTVNLSLGTKWNADTVPDWASLEDEFAKLESVGIFISVAAGNSFKSFNETGLSYPAASEHVVPVGSHDANGQMSDFSQRNDRILVAPGEKILSTIPEHVMGGKGPAKSFYSASGTSMATPYVAGAAALVRQAMEFMGQQNISQDTIYDHFRATADKIYDNVTNAYYDKINVGNAIDSIVGDLHGNNVNSATDLGQVNGNKTLNGTVGKSNDLDYFTFTAANNGTVSFTVDSTHDLDADLGLIGATLNKSGNTYSFQAEAGKAYTLHVGTSSGIGHYDIEMQSTKSFEITAKDWGQIGQKSIAGISANGESWHQFNASRDGIVTVELTGGNAKDSVRFDVYDSKLRLIDSNVSGDAERIDFNGNKGESYFVRFKGNGGSVDAQVTNLVSLQDKSLRISGTSRADQLDVDLSKGVSVSVNGVDYSFTNSQIDQVVVRAGKGTDSLHVVGSNASESIAATEARFHMKNANTKVSGLDAEIVSFDGRGGVDRAFVKDTIGTDSFVGREDFARMSGTNYTNSFANFEIVRVTSHSGNDTADLYDTKGNDLLIAKGDHVRMRSAGQFVSVKGFEQVDAFSKSGNDSAMLHDTVGNDNLISRSNATTISGKADSGNSYRTVAASFERVTAIAKHGGNDVASMYGTRGNDLIISKNGDASVRNTTMFNLARGFETVNFDAMGGNDEGRFFVSGKSTLVDITKTEMSFSSKQSNVVATGLNNVQVLGGSGVDSIVFSEIGRTDEVLGIGALARVSYNGLTVTAKDFEHVTAQSKAGESANAELKAIDFLFTSVGDWD